MSDTETLFKTIEKEEASNLALLKTWVAHNTHSYNIDGLQSFLESILPHFSKLGAMQQIITPNPIHILDSKGQKRKQKIGPILHLIQRPNAKKKVLLSIHMDTVFPKNSTFQTVRELSPTKWQGPGIIDAKGGLLILLKSLLAFETLPQKKDLGWEVIISSDEEIGSPCSSSLLSKRAQLCQFGMVFEPPLPDGAYVSERMGSANVSVLSRGTAAHVGRAFTSGNNAILNLCRFIDVYKQSPNMKKLLKNIEEDTHQDALSTLINIGTIIGGTASNVVPDTCVCEINIRSKTHTKLLSEINTIQNILDTLNKKTTAQLELITDSIRPPKPFSPATKTLFKLVENCSKILKLPFSYASTGGVCDGNILAHANCPNIDTLGPNGAGLHTQEEYLNTKSITEKIKLSTLILCHLAQA
mgnify:FL=1